MRTYILEGHNVVPEPDIERWAQQCQDVQNIAVKKTYLEEYKVSTVFLWIDHNYLNIGPPLLFETMIFGLSDENEYQKRCSTWEEAEVQHEEALKWLQERK